MFEWLVVPKCKIYLLGFALTLENILPKELTGKYTKPMTKDLHHNPNCAAAIGMLLKCRINFSEP